MSDPEIIDLPFIIGGREFFFHDAPEETALRLSYPEAGTIIRFPAIDAIDEAAFFAAQEAMAALTIGDILDFLAEVGALWADPSYGRYREAFALMTRLTDFSEEELALDFSYIPALLARGGYLEAMLQAELGDPAILDSWITRGGCEVRAFPRGRALHVLAGNVPGVELISLARGLMTKNANVLKMARGNPVTPVALVQSFADVDPDHPVTRSTSAIYWTRGSATEIASYQEVQSACVWGGFDAVHAAWAQARYGLEILDYGPKRSMVFIGKATLATEAETRAAAKAVAEDTVVHDQQACHSPQVVFVEGDADGFARALGEALDLASEALPRGDMSIDQKTQLGHFRNMAELLGDKVTHAGTTAWTLVVTEDFARTATNPLGRSLWILPVASLADAVSHADAWTMVAAFSRRAELEAYRDALASRGVDRLTLVGHMGLLPPGTPHEGRYDLTRLVKFVSADLTPDPSGAFPAPDTGDATAPVLELPS